MKVLILGATGMLGHKLVQVLSERFDTVATMRGTLDDLPQYSLLRDFNIVQSVGIDDIPRIEDLISEFRPDVVINAIGVIKQLPSSKDIVRTLEINSIFPQKLADLAVRRAFRLITISTDCVFAGTNGNYTEEDTPDALDLYGRSKQYGEVSGKGCLTLRTSIIGRELSTSHSLIDWFLSNENRTVKGFANAIYSGFPTIVLANIIESIILKFPDLEGLYHVSSSPINKYDLLEIVRRNAGVDIEIIRDEEFVIDRSLNSERFRQVTGYIPPSWPEMIGQMFADPTPYSELKRIALT